MSEYQYYEFLALDRPLTAEQRAELRSISTRAEITATRFTNEYHWGDLKGDPRQMMERYFDAFLYLANWGTRQVMFRLPRGVLDPATARQYCGTDTASLIETGSHLILSLGVDQEEPDDYWDEPGGQLAAMVQARSELAGGDLRLLYLAWLLVLQSDEVYDEDVEPPVPPGLGNLSAGLQAVVDFFEIDEDLIAVAAAASPPIEEPRGLAEWIASVEAKEKDGLLARVAGGEGAAVQALLIRRFRAVSGSAPATPGRTAAELWEAAADRKERGRRLRKSAGARRKPARRRRRRPHMRSGSTSSLRGEKRPGRRSRSGSRRGAPATMTWPYRCCGTCRRSPVGRRIRPRSGSGSWRCVLSTTASPPCRSGSTRRACPANHAGWPWGPYRRNTYRIDSFLPVS